MMKPKKPKVKMQSIASLLMFISVAVYFHFMKGVSGWITVPLIVLIVISAFAYGYYEALVDYFPQIKNKEECENEDL